MNERSPAFFCTLFSPPHSLTTPFSLPPGALSHRAVGGLYHLTLMCNLADLNTPYSVSAHPCLDNLPKQTDRFGGSGPLRLPVQSSDHYKKHRHLKKETVGFENQYVFPLIPAHTRFANIRFLIISYNYFCGYFHSLLQKTNTNIGKNPTILCERQGGKHPILLSQKKSRK